MDVRLTALPFLVLSALAACDKGSDSAGSSESDTDTDSDSDTDTDGLRHRFRHGLGFRRGHRYRHRLGFRFRHGHGHGHGHRHRHRHTDFSADIHVTITVAKTGDVVCDTMIQLTGTPYAGTCPDCEFAYEVDGEITAEKGSGCDPSYFTPFLTYIDDAKSSAGGVYLAFSDVGMPYDTKTENNILWLGTYSTSTSDVEWEPNAFDGSIFGVASYAKGLLEWKLDYLGSIAVPSLYPYYYYYQDTYVYVTGTGHVF